MGSKQAFILERLIEDAISDEILKAIARNNKQPVRLSALTEFELKFADYLDCDDDEFDT